MSLRALGLLLLATSLGCASTGAAQPPTQAAASAEAVVDRPLVFVAATGLEDVQTLTSVFRHATAAATTGRLSEVVVLVYGRAIAAFDGELGRRPPELLARIREALEAGVRVLLCANALAGAGIAQSSVDPTPTAIVPRAIVTLVDYVARGAAVVRY